MCLRLPVFGVNRKHGEVPTRAGWPFMTHSASPMNARPLLAASLLLLASSFGMSADATPAPATAVAVDPALFMARPIENGYTWTLASRLGDMLHLAETMFGPRDPSYTVLGVEFVADNPRVWYPGNRKFI